ncbi:tripartite tricarboxylate transporter substrate binding protein [Billgrantia diversa]|uniref:Bug family tripartite tricarboxylate transporter substrate binding protein n=1 Tax=Halomonas sp. MCCC 1A13316 TaxID=2733487 RepID=UPI0018A3B11E|nr:tripartite tricarboxylate transporter substrate binding protein [Halomonas sp. MCCC 1A13316]QOR37989.1 tripartite tricarboxylate transporter substrate binding protein [Halomonas sp. MCCC 1A13316]
MKKVLVLMTTVAILATGSLSAQGQQAEYPNKPIQMIIPYSAGGGTDAFARNVIRFSDLADDIVVRNIAGGGGKIGTMEVVNARPDGYTLLGHVMAIAIGYHAGLYDTPPWEDLIPISSITLEDSAISVNADSPFKTIEELIKYAKANPGDLSYGFAGVGGTTHTVTASFANETGIDVNLIPFSGGADSRAALAGGHIDVMSSQVSEIIDMVEAGDLRILATTGSERHYLTPDVPSLKERGIDFVFQVWRGFFAPAGTPDEVVSRVSDSFEEATKNEEFIDVMKKLGYQIEFRDSDEFLAEIKRNHEEVAKISHLLKAEQ